MLKRLLILFFFVGIIFGVEREKLPGFAVTSYFGEQTVTFSFLPKIRVHINAPSIDNYDSSKPVGLALYALPNGNSIEQTVGKSMKAGVDWHYNIQHIGAQTRFLRNMDLDYNLVTVYLETEQKSWPAWKSETVDYEKIVRQLVRHLQSSFDNEVDVILTGHSGGGRFVFSFLDGVSKIPEYVNRICFLDSDYGYTDSYGEKLKNWLESGADKCLSVLAYNDSIALYNGKPIVSATGGTWYRSKMMKNFLEGYFSFNTEENDEMINHRALEGRISILLKKNPEQEILHTVQVERNGFIHSMLTGTKFENSGYEYYGEHVYDSLIQEEELDVPNVQIPPRSALSSGGAEFMNKIKSMEFSERETAIYHEFITGNIPDFYRELVTIEASFKDNNGNPRKIQYRVMPDYLAIGCDTNFCRVPMGPITAQRIADFYGMTMPTSKLVDNIYKNAEIKLAPITYYPVGNENEKVEKFILHNEAIQQQFNDANGVLGQLTGGIKKDVIISNKLSDTSRNHHVIIYGWHQLNGKAIQPIYNGHIDSYVDYSHGVRLLDSQILVDGENKSIHQILRNPELYKILSNENGIMNRTSYLSNSSFPEKPTSFGIRSSGKTSLQIVVKPNNNIDRCHLYISQYGASFDHYTSFSGSEYEIQDLEQGKILFVRLRSENKDGLSDFSEVLAAVPEKELTNRALIVNGYDRPQEWNTYDFY